MPENAEQRLDATSTAPADSNDDTINAWNGVLFEKFCRFREVLTRGLGSHGTYAIGQCELAGRRVIDLGAGFGDTTLELGARAREAVGVDAAPRFVADAERLAREAGAQNVRHFVADVQLSPLQGPYDLAFSRFGVQFFAQPVAALRNVARSLAPGGRLCVVVWRRREDNPAMYVAERIAAEIVPEPERHDQPTCGPGPFSMADADLVSEQLRIAGYTEIRFERRDAPICVGAGLEEAVAFALELGPAGERLRLAREEGERLRPVVARALRDAFTPLLRENGIWLDSSTWIVTARKKGESEVPARAQSRA